ncbi:MAG TPA: thioesterase family protein [bacterium]|jgi:acyl-CoA thioester hydrolase|nr:thioesterase family protein [bacterium]
MIWAEVEVRPEFYDIDPLQVVWHGNYVRFLEIGRGALLESLDYGYERMRASGWSFPVVDLSLHYVKPAVLGQRLVVRAELAEWENRLVITYEIRDALTSLRLTKASTTQVAVNAATGELNFVCPAELVERVERALRKQP